MGDEPEVIMQNMEETRSALTEKLETLEQQVVSTVQEATVAVADTVDSVKAAVQETVDQVKDTVQGTVSSVKETVSETVDTVKQSFDLSLQARERPWVVFGAAVAIGFVGGKLLGPGERLASRVWSSARRPFAAGTGPHHGSRYGEAGFAGRPVSEASPEEVASRMSEASDPAAQADAGPGIFGQLAQTFEPEIAKLKGMAIGSLMGSIRHLVADQLPAEFRPQVTEMVDSMTRKLGGEPIRTA